MKKVFATLFTFVLMVNPRRDFQGVWDGWKVGLMAFHAPPFPWLVFGENRFLGLF